VREAEKVFDFVGFTSSYGVGAPAGGLSNFFLRQQPAALAGVWPDTDFRARHTWQYFIAYY